MRLLGSRSLAWFVVGYGAILLVLLPVLSLWLDEVIMIGTAYQPTWRAMLDSVTAGYTPLSFLPPRWVSLALGESAFSARFPSALASWAACPAVFLLARRMRLQTPMLAVVAFAILPLQFRYALEARPYALALCLTLWATEFFLERPSALRSALYVLFMVMAALAQPYAAFVAVAHLGWAFLYNRKQIYVPIAALALAGAVLIPWYASYRDAWAAQMAREKLAGWDWRTGLVFLREISGSGYIGSAILFTGVAFGLRKGHEPKRFWLLWIATPLIAVVVANAVFQYFFAVRQLIYILPVLALLFVAGAESLGNPGKCLFMALMISSLWGNINWFKRPREDWSAASNAIASQVSRGGCVVFLGESKPLYLVFHPELEIKQCSGDSDRVIVGTIPYGASTYDATITPLIARGLVKQSEQSFEGPRVEVFSK